MKTIYTLLVLCLFSLGLSAQEISDQNPNHKNSYQKYLKVSDSYTQKQGTTEQQTYVAIDPMEEKRIRKKIRKDSRAMRRVWRHEERLEAAKNTRVRVYRNGYNTGWNTNFGINYGFGFGRRGFSVFNGWNRPFIGCSTNWR